MQSLLSSTYLGPVSWYAALARSSSVIIDGGEHYVKQSWRNRCRILMPDGPQDLIIPVEGASSHSPIRDLRISEHGQWRHHHWNALRTAYGKSPFFEYYADDFAPFYEQRHAFLLDYNVALCRLVCQLLDIDVPIQVSSCYVEPSSFAGADLRAAFSPRTAPSSAPSASCGLPDEAAFRPYYQVFADRQHFVPNLSIADLLFNMGPEGLLCLTTVDS